jgi:hypothetical protein
VTAVAHVLSPALVKEVRALLPTYCAALFLVVIGSFTNSHTMIAAGLLGFAFGSVALGAQSFGHEYTHRTLGLLLSQPLDRRRLFFYKVAVLSVMLTTLTATTLVMYHELLRRAASPHTEPAMLVLAAACGLFVAPCLTMLCRSTLAAIVFTIAVPGLLRTGSDVVGALIYGLDNAAAVDRFSLVVFWRGMFLVCALAAVAGWRMFMRLEVIEGHGAHVQLPESVRVGSATTVPRRRHYPVWALVTKELRLQQITFVVGALFGVVMMGLLWLNHSRPDMTPLPLISVTLLYAGIVAILIGSLASAQERQLGTLEWQTLLPVHSATQWIVKIGVVWGLSVVLGVAVPVLLGLFGQSGELFLRSQVPLAAVAMIALTTASLYVSSLCTSAMPALVLSFPSILATLLLLGVVGDTVDAQVRRWRAADAPSFLLGPAGFDLVRLALAAGLIGLLVQLAFRNHWSADRSAVRTLKQAATIAVYITLGAVVLVGLAR